MRVIMKLVFVFLFIPILFGCNAQNSKKDLLINMNEQQRLGRESKEGLEEYKKQIQVINDELVTKLDKDRRILVTITFSKPLSKDEVEKLILAYDLRVKMVHFRGIENGSSMRTTGGSKDYKSIQMNEIASHGSFIGFIELIADVRNEDMVNLIQDKNVYLVDPLADDYFIRHLRKDYRSGMFWSLEDFFITNN